MATDYSKELMEINKSIGGIEAKVTTLAELQEHNCEVSNARDDEIIMELKTTKETLSSEMTSNNKKVLKKFADHEQYHKEYEHRFGLLTLIKEKPKYVFLFGIIAGGLAATGLGMSVGKIIKFALLKLGVPLP